MKEFCKNIIFIEEIPLKFFGMQLGTRMTVIRLANNKLFLHSPTKLTSRLIDQLNKLGVSNNDNYACIMDMVQDITIPEITEFDKDLAGVPSTLTNVT